MAVPVVLVPIAYEALLALGTALAGAAAVLAAAAGGKKLAEAVSDAQDDADANSSSATTVAPLSATVDCKDCKPNENCGKWLEQAKRSLYSVKIPKNIGGKGGGPKGLMQRLCEWIHGTAPDGGDHRQAVADTLKSLEKARRNLTDEKNRCVVPDDVRKDMEENLAKLGTDGAGLMNLPHLPRPNFQKHCLEQALKLAAKHLAK